MALYLSSDAGEPAAGELSEINVVPFIDVMLVLLIIFMVAAPLATVDIKVDLPQVNPVAAPPRDTPPLTLSIRADGALFLQEEPVTLETLGAALETASGGDREERLFIHADQDLPYGQLMGVVERVRGAGFLRVAFVGLESAAP
ncbi:biopolymer transporter ExbD [Phaeovibrio sulfidiphilus]|uniref:Biopolymer transporter ExbD n=1 Tax=Phaeovibrio sulfidiphilus TaxID=1220600 RepID=A0A8J6YLC6_9PROT|nr:biopolymer transporter ExbD [Phaeovibrio sulfidiphilus]MBE1236515.1 biopolymer transporter ExbD [Phaeovibrio sulfidiphilus]